MWSEEFDKKAQEAAGNHSPSYEEKNWDSMEALLDKHLPVEKKKRRFIFWFILPLAVGITTLLFITIKPGQSTKGLNKTADNTNKVEKNQDDSQKQPPGKSTGDPEIESPGSSPGSSVTRSVSDNQDFVDQPMEKTDPSSQSSNPSTESAPQVFNQDKKSNGSASTTNSTVTKSDNKSVKNSKNKTKPAPANKTPESNTGISGSNSGSVSGTVPLTSTAIQTPDPIASAPVDNAGINKQDASSSELKTTDTTQAKTDTEQKIAETPKSTAKKPGRSKDKGLFAGISLGPDVSGLGMNNTGSWRMQYGLTIGYAFSKKLSVRTGFFTGRKVYTADPSEYHPPYNFWIYYPKLEKIDANCLVYEIPLTAVYNFKTKGKHNWFVSAGASTYLMKDETYDYYYKNSWGNTEVRTRTISNENNHFFSIINLSGGYNYRINDRFFLMAEPYLKLPVSGVGFGNVKLNSAGILFTTGLKF